MRAEKRQEALLAALEAGDAEAVADTLAGASEAERRALKPALSAYVPRWERKGVEMQWSDRQPFCQALRAARLGIETLTEMKKDWRDIDGDAQLGARILGDRCPAWLDSWAAWFCDRPGGWVSRFWPTVRALVRSGHCQRPDHPGYVLGMLAGVLSRHGDGGRDETWEDRKRRYAAELADALQQDAGLLEVELWQLFSTEGTRDVQLNYVWAEALVLLAEQGVVSRERLLDASLEALARDFAQFKAGWYSRFHEALAPTLEERAARVEGYLALCASRIPPTVSFALDALSLLNHQTTEGQPGGLAAERVAAHVPAALMARAKKSAFAALALLDHAATRDPTVAPTVARALTEALSHETAAVQERALASLERLVPDPSADAQLCADVAERAPGLAASLRARLQAWLGEAAEARTETPGAELSEEALCAAADALPANVAAAIGVDLALAALDSSAPARAARVTRSGLPGATGEPLAIVSELDALIELHAALLERVDEPLDFERLLAGLSRYAATEPPDLGARLAPLVRRAKTVIKRSWGAPFSAAASIPSAIAGLALAWAERVVPGPSSKNPRAEHRWDRGTQRQPGPLMDVGLDSFFVHRLREVAEKLANKCAEPLLATPSHESGFVAAEALLARGRSLSRAPGLYDGVQGLLRLAPERRAEALAAFPRAGSEIGRAFRYALGAALSGAVTTPAWWIAAARARDPEGAAPELAAHLGPLAGAPDAAQPATITWHTQRDDRWTRLWVECEPRPPSKIPAATPTVGLYDGAHPISYDDGTLFPGGGGLGEAVEVKLAAQIWPLSRESYYAEGARAIGGNLSWWEAEWANRHFLEPLLDPNEPCGPMATLLVALGLCAKEPGENALAVDIAIAAIEEGRIDGQALGAVYGRLLPSNLLIPARLAQALGELARVSPAHAAHARVALCGALRGEPIRGINVVLELLRELCIEADRGVDDAEARAFLQTFKGGSKAAVAARALLALEAGPRAAEHARRAALSALDGRLRRAESLL